MEEKIINNELEQLKSSKDYDLINELKSKTEEKLVDTVETMRMILRGKPTSQANSESMSEITLIQLTGLITEDQLRLYVDKYKDYPMILNFLKQIGEKNGYEVIFKSRNELGKVIETLEKDIRDFLNNYDSQSDNHKYKAMIIEGNGNYFKKVELELERFRKDNKITISKVN